MSVALRAIACVSALLLVGCLAGKTPVDRFYRIDIPPSATPLDRPILPGVLEVERPSADALVRERQILRASPGSAELIPYPYQLWTDSPVLLVQRSLAGYLRSAGVADQVVTPDTLVEEEWIVTGHLGRMEQVQGGDPEVVVELDLALARRGRGELVMRQSYRSRQAAAGENVSDAVDAVQRALAEIYARFVADLASAR